MSRVPRIQFVSATLVFGWLVFDITLPSSRYQTSLGVSQSRTFMGVSLISWTMACRSSSVRSSKLVLLGRYRLRSNALRGLARIHWWRHSWLILICGSAGHSTFSRPSMSSGVHPLRSASMTCFASMFVRQVRQCFSVVWADGFPRCRHRFPVM